MGEGGWAEVPARAPSTVYLSLTQLGKLALPTSLPGVSFVALQEWERAKASPSETLSRGTKYMSSGVCPV